MVGVGVVGVVGVGVLVGLVLGLDDDIAEVEAADDDDDKDNKRRLSLIRMIIRMIRWTLIRLSRALSLLCCRIWLKLRLYFKSFSMRESVW